VTTPKIFSVFFISILAAPACQMDTALEGDDEFVSDSFEAKKPKPCKKNCGSLAEPFGLMFDLNGNSIDFERLAIARGLLKKDPQKVGFALTLDEIRSDGETSPLADQEVLLANTLLVDEDGGPGRTALIDVDWTTNDIVDGASVLACAQTFEEVKERRGRQWVFVWRAIDAEKCVELLPVRPS
jgi:hypothetical protein